MLLPEAKEWIESKLIKNDKKVLNSNSSIETGSEASLKINLDSSCFSGTDYTSQTSETETDTKDECESDITTSEIVPKLIKNVTLKSNDEVTSSETESIISSPIIRTESVDSLVSSQQPQSSDRDDTLELDCGQIDGEEDCDEENERFNPKQSVERENNVRFQRPMRGMMSQRGNRLYGPRPGHSFPPGHPYNKNENYNPHSFHSVPQQNQIMPQQPNMYPPNFRHPHPNNMRPPPQQQQLPPHPNMYRGPRPDFIQNQNMGGPPFRPFNPNMVRGSMPGQFDQMRPRMMVSGQQFHNQRPPQQRPQFIGGGPIHRMGVAPQMVHQVPQSSGVMLPQPVVPRKVLINPNFKGGVEAATNQLMMDTLNSKAQYGPSIDTHSHDDDELLRQQEEFINRNRQHIEKRRHERSPDRDREYSPPRRERRAFSRERDSSFRNSYRGGRRDDRNVPKRRRSGSFERQRNDEGKEKDVSFCFLLIFLTSVFDNFFCRWKKMRRLENTDNKLKIKKLKEKSL